MLIPYWFIPFFKYISTTDQIDDWFSGLQRCSLRQQIRHWIIVGVIRRENVVLKTSCSGKEGSQRGSGYGGDISLSGYGTRFCPTFVLCRSFAEEDVRLSIPWNWCEIRKRAQVALLLIQQLLSAGHGLTLVSHKHKTLFKTSWSFPSWTGGFTRFVYLIKAYMWKEYKEVNSINSERRQRRCNKTWKHSPFRGKLRETISSQQWKSCHGRFPLLSHPTGYFMTNSAAKRWFGFPLGAALWGGWITVFFRLIPS